jgi:hypothetical protein
MIAIEDVLEMDIRRVGFAGIGCGAVAFVAITVLFRVRLAAVAVITAAKSVSRCYVLDTPAAAPLTFGTVTAAVGSPLTVAVLGFVTGVTFCALVVAAKEVRVCAANSS